MGNEAQKGIFDTLKELGLASEEAKSIYSECTRDNESLMVYRDLVSGIIYIDDYFVGNETYAKGAYRDAKDKILGKPSYERVVDTERRIRTLKHLIVDRDIADFGCGTGLFLREAHRFCKSSMGIELQEDLVASLGDERVKCKRSVDELEADSIDTFFSFHSFEHLPDPLGTLTTMKGKIRKGGSIVIEVPHANDFLLQIMGSIQFKEYTLWSQHLLLHTRQSIQRFLSYAGFHDVVIQGVQRYPLSNHLWWLARNRPGGHKTSLAIIDEAETTSAYEAALRGVDATDTLLAVGIREE